MGFLAAFFCACFLTSKDLVSKRLAYSVSGTVSAFASFFFALPGYFVLLLVLWLLGLEDFSASWKFMTFILLRSTTDVFAEWSKMNAFAHGDISLVSCFVSLTPIFLLFTSPLITGDQIPPVGILAVLFIFAGTLLMVVDPKRKDSVAQPPQTKAIAFALAGAFFFSLNACFDRLAVLSASAPLSGFGMTLLSAIFLAPFVIPKSESRKELFRYRHGFLTRGIIEVAFMVSKLLALQYLQAPYVVGIQKVSLLFSIVGGKLIYKEEHFRRRLFAGGIIFIGILFIIYAQTSGAGK